MKRGTTLFLKMAVILIGIPVLALGIFGVTWLTKNPANPEYAHILYPIVIGMYVSVIPFFVALVQAFKLLGYIDRNQAFSELSVKALKNIKFCAITITVVYAIVLPFVFMVAQLDDAPGLVIVGMVPIFASMVIAVFAAVLQRLLQEAIDIKSENDLTV
jgi:signal transduction histidine kinase